MQRRTLISLFPVGLVLAAQNQAWALSLADLTASDASSGVQAALEQGALAAIGLLGKPDGFLANPLVRIPLPGYLEGAGKLLRVMGQGKRLDELVHNMNRAAEAAIPLGKDVLVGAVKSMNFSDAKNILSGGDNAVTQFFVEKTRAPLGETFLPIVTQAVAHVGLAQSYNKLAAQAMQLGLIKPNQANIETYVTGKSLDGLYTIIGEEEKKIRKDPVATGSALLKKVFGALK